MHVLNVLDSVERTWVFNYTTHVSRLRQQPFSNTVNSRDDNKKRKYISELDMEFITITWVCTEIR